MKKYFKFNKNLLLIILGMGLAFASCKKDNLDGGKNDDDKGTGSVSDKTIELVCSDFDGDLELKNSSAAVDYIINCNASIKSKITIEPGTVIAFGPDAALHFTTGTIKAVGTDDEPIIFRGEEQVSGYWKGIMISSNSNDNQLSHAIIRHAGSSHITYNSINSLRLEDGRVSISDLTVEEGDGVGIRVSDKIKLGNFSRIRVKSHADFPLAISTSQLGDIDGENSDFSGNEKDMVQLFIEEANRQMTVKKINIPYYIDRLWNIAAEVDFNAGTKFVFSNSASILVKSNGSLAMNGQSSDPIELRGEIDEPGSWNGVYYDDSNSSKNVIKNVSITGAGRKYIVCCGDGSSLTAKGTISLDNVTVKNGSGRGITFGNNAKIRGFNDVTVTSHELEPIRLNIEQATELYGESSDFTGNTNDYVYINSTEVKSPSKLHKLNVPYLLDGATININSHIDINPGVRIILDTDAGLNVKGGSIAAIGSSNSPITFEGMNDSRGTWRGIEVASTSSKNEFRYVDIRNAGSKYINCCSISGLEIKSNAEMKLKSVSFTKNKGCALRYDPSSNSVTLDDVTFNDNEEDICEI